MKLRNKKTGEIADLEHKGLLKSDNSNHIVVYPEGALKYYTYNSLAHLNEEWEDYEEPKRGWYIVLSCNDIRIYEDLCLPEEVSRKLKEIGNYFETKEEAEKTVEKLKAWKRLKDKGFRFIGVREIGRVIDFYIPKKYRCAAFDKSNIHEDALELYNDLLLLFGGKE